MTALLLLASILVLSLGVPGATADQRSDTAQRNPTVAGLLNVRVEAARRVRGRHFQWDHGIQVALPPSYATSSASYPVLWVTDGPMYFELAAKAANYDLRSHVPEMIVVAVGPPTEELEQLGHRRSYEFSPSTLQGFAGFGSNLLDRQLRAAEDKRKAAGLAVPPRGGAGRFLGLLVDELRPQLSREYRMSEEHVLFGDSGGGVFCVYALLARPDSFTRYICGSPNLYSGDLELFRMEEAYSKAHHDLKAIVFFGAGEGEMTDANELVRAWGVVSATSRMVEILGSRKYPSLKLNARIFPGEDHASVAALNLSAGLRAVWTESQR